MAVAVDQHHAFKPFALPPRCKRPSYSHFDFAMLESSCSHATKPPQNNNSASNSFHKSFSTPCLSTASQEDKDDSGSRIEIIAGNGAPRVRALVVEVTIAIASGVISEPISSGLGGAYFLRSRNGETIAVAKPIDEEPLAFNNPKGFAGRMLGQPGIKKSIRIGETGFRELAAYLLDHGGFAGVPPTALVKMCYNKFNTNSSDPTPPYKIASLQRFVDHESDAGDLGPCGFSVSAVHRIGILDIRLFNLDRHAGNILVKKGLGVADLVPIDHGFCLPESLEDPYFEWLHWPQASIPFSEVEMDYIASLDPFKDAELLRVEIPLIRESSIRILLLTTIFLKNAATFGLCQAEIGEMMTRDFNGGHESWSAFESLCMEAKTSIANRISNYEDLRGEQEANDVEEQDIDVFQLDDADDSSMAGKGKPGKMIRIASERLFTQVLDDSEEGDVDDNKDSGKMSSSLLLRSISFATPNPGNDHEDISFGDMIDETWDVYLDKFHELLPEFLVERKCMCLSKQRLGTSCEF